MFFPKRNDLPSVLTSYDFIKFATLFFMFVDHIGAYIYPDELWWRVLGRMGFPAWFFLAGYARGRDISKPLIIGTILLIIPGIILGQYILPINALGTIILIRLLIDKIATQAFKSEEQLIYTTFILFILGFATTLLFEYGTHAFLLALFGYAIRNKETLNLSKYTHSIFCAVVAVSITWAQIFQFGFDFWQSIGCWVGMLFFSIILYRFEPKEYPKISELLPKFITKTIAFGGRYTLELYVIHLIILKVILYMSYPDKFELFMPRLFA